MNRIDKIVEFVDENKIVADIGSDHGITAIKIYEEKKPKKVIATDISKESLQKLVDKLQHSRYDIETIVTDGIRDLPKNIDEIIISGMGGYLISKIIKNGIDVAKLADKLILQANNSLDHLRKFLHSEGFEIIDEANVYEENYIYTIIVTKYTNQVNKYDNNDYYIYGKKNIENKDELTIKYIERELNHSKTVINNIKSNDTIVVKNRIKELEDKINCMENLLCKLKS
ncbi:tRNA (adenine(22)-N(1))-methyltransferase [Helcococcus sueciensis]|uniref:tRNA (adenine(22)-N(1))-methyltransferase n=1 Tax=Helcococcus sueciensis TaxID=241555 RepID=UPI0003F70C17|nr:class I SAM-dependent methyltransferase [Helcococcus sueciensis]